MLLLILSDSHGNRSAIRQVIEAEPEGDVIVFLGDGAREADEFRDALPTMLTNCRDMRIVRGNCDLFEYGYENEICFRADQVTVFACHGHTRHVKSGTDYLYAIAKMRGASLALFGHTHEPHLHTEDGITFLNPGSVGLSPDGKKHYALVHIRGNELRAELCTLS